MLNLILAFNYNPIFNDKSNDKIVIDIDQFNDCDELNELKLSSNQPNGKPFLIEHHSKVSNSFLNKDLPTNVSFPLYADWISKNVTIEYEGVSIKKQRISNGGFDTDASGWTYKSNAPTKYVNDTVAGAVKITMTSGVTFFLGQYGYYEQNITLNDELASGKTAVLSTDYYYWGFLPAGVNVYLAVIMGGIEKNITYDHNYIAQTSWQSLNIIYDPKAYGQILPGIITIRVGLYADPAFLITGQPAYILFDNIKLDLWSMPNDKNLVYAYDVEFPANYSYASTSYGSGYSFVQRDRSRNSTQDVIFTIYNNITGILDFAIYNITIESDVVKLYNSTIFSLEGSSYSTGLNITWNSEFLVSIPFGYLNSWGSVKKPADWIIQEVTDLYNINHVGNCTGVGFGSENLIIPSNIFGIGLWKLKAISQNYICKTNFLIWNSSQFIEDTKLTFNDIYQVNVTLNNSLSLSNTKVNFTINYPDNSIFFHESKEPTAHVVNFGNFTVGDNMSVGNYKIIIEWTNKDTYLMRDKVGYAELNFIVWHHTNLTAVNSDLERMAGDPTLIKVNFTDDDFNSSIEFATITYNSTFGQFGTMIYLGAGIYFIEIDSSSLELGNYYFSFNATKEYYQNQTKIDLIHLKIIGQPLKLEVPKTVINAVANSYAICQINVTGALSDTPIWPANLSTDWQNPYTVIDHNNGTFTLNFSTWNLPIQGITETFTISIFASAIDYGNTTGYIAMNIFPIETILGANKSIFTVDLGESVNVKINYTVEGSGSLILGANCSVNWPSLYNITPDAQGFVIRFDTVNLSIDTYTAIIKLEKPGFETAYESIIIIINRINIEVNTIGFQDSIDAYRGDKIIIKISLTEPGTKIYIENASVFYSWDFGGGLFDYVGNGTYELELTLPSDKGNHKMTLSISKEGSIYKTKEFSFIISINVREQPNYIVWYILSGFLIGISILGGLTLRSYVILPIKRKKKSDLLAKTQRYKDVMNIEAIILSNRISGVHLYSKSYYILPEYQNELLSGFTQAIIMMSSEIVGKEESERIAIKPKYPKGIEKIIELDFKHFNFIICDYKNIRLIFILKERVSERFKDQATKLLMEIDSNFPDKFKKWDGNLRKFNTLIPPLLEQYFQLHYRDPFKLNKTKNIDRLKKEGQLSKMELRLLNVIISMTIEKEKFYLENAIRNVYEKNQDKIIEALEMLIEKQILIPSIE